MRTVLIDYNSGNLHSAAKAFERMARETDGGQILVSSDPKDVARADRIVLPGDGAFPHCMETLHGFDGLAEALREAVEVKARPFLGICVGMQLMATTGREYRDTDGLNWIGGDIVRIEPGDRSFKVPHMGWNDLVIDAPHPVMDGLSSGDHVYFVHSYRFAVADSANLIAHCDYGGPVAAVVGRDNMVGAQFHPEKSQQPGLRLIANFLNWTP